MNEKIVIAQVNEDLTVLSVECQVDKIGGQLLNNYWVLNQFGKDDIEVENFCNRASLYPLIPMVHEVGKMIKFKSEKEWSISIIGKHTYLFKDGKWI